MMVAHLDLLLFTWNAVILNKQNLGFFCCRNGSDFVGSVFGLVSKRRYWTLLQEFTWENRITNFPISTTSHQLWIKCIQDTCLEVWLLGNYLQHWHSSMFHCIIIHVFCSSGYKNMYVSFNDFQSLLIITF